MRFTARVITGAGRGKHLGVPTLNLDLRDVPRELQDGVYACSAVIDGAPYIATMHSGPRPTFGDTRSCEVHLIDHALSAAPEVVTVDVADFLRSIKKYPSAEALTAQMQKDIAQAKEILGTPTPLPGRGGRFFSR